MNILTQKKCELLNDYQRHLIEDSIKNKRDYMLIVTIEDNKLYVYELCDTNDLYDFLYVNYEKLNIKSLYKLNDNYTLSMVDILLDLIKKENEFVKKYRQVLINVNLMLKKYNDYTIQYAYENYLTNEYIYHSTRSLLSFINEIRKHRSNIYCVNRLIYDACLYVITNDINLEEWSIDFE